MSDLVANLTLRIRQLGLTEIVSVKNALQGITAASKAASKGVDFDLAAKAGQAAEAMAHAREKLRGFIEEPVDKFKEFELTMARVRGHMNHLSDEDFGKLTNAAKQAGLTSFFSSQQAAEGLEAFAMQGLSAKQQMDALTPTMALAQAGHVDLSEAARVTIETMHQFGMKSSDTQHITDVLARTFTSASTDGLHGLSEAFKYVGPNAHAAGLSLEQTATFAGLLGNAGLSGSIAGTTLTAVISRLAFVTPRASKALASVGYSSQKMAKDLQNGGPTEVLAKLEEHMDAKKLNKWQRMSVLIRLFGSEAAKGVQTLMEKSRQVGDDGKTGFEHLAEEIAHADGQTKKFTDSLSRTTAGQLQMAQNQIESLKLQLGEGFAPAAIKAANAFKPVANALTDFAKNHDEITAGVGTGITGLVAVMGPATGAAFAISNLATAYSTLKKTKESLNLAAEAAGYKNAATAAGGLAAKLSLVAAAAWAGYEAGQALDKALASKDSKTGSWAADHGIKTGEDDAKNDRWIWLGEHIPGLGWMAEAGKGNKARNKAERDAANAGVGTGAHPNSGVQRGPLDPDKTGKPQFNAVTGQIEIKVTDDRVAVKTVGKGPIKLRTGHTPHEAR